MNKLFTKIVGAALGATMAIGVGVAVANNRELNPAKAVDYSLEYTLDGTITGGDSGYATVSSITQSNIDWSATGNTTQNPWRIGGKSLNGVNRAIYSTEPISADIAKIEVTSGTSTLDSVNSLTITVHSNANDASTGSNAIATKTEETESNIVSKTVILTKSDSTSWTGKYYRIVYNVTKTAKSNAYVQFKNAKFYSASGGDTPTVSSITKKTDPTKTAYVSGESFDPAGLVVTVSYESGSSEDVPYTGNESDFSWSPTKITAAGNVEIQYKTYSTMKVTQAVTLKEADKFEKITTLDGLMTGSKYLIGKTDGSVFMSSTQNNNNRGIHTLTGTITDNKVGYENGMEVLELGGSTGEWTLYATKSDTKGYLYAASSSSNYLRTQATNNANGQWAIALSSGNFKLTAQGANTHNGIQYNASSSIFSCYTSASEVSLWKFVDTTESVAISKSSVSGLKTDSDTSVSITAKNFTPTNISVNYSTANIASITKGTISNKIIPLNIEFIGTGTTTATISVLGGKATYTCTLGITVSAKPASIAIKSGNALELQNNGSSRGYTKASLTIKDTDGNDYSISSITDDVTLANVSGDDCVTISGGTITAKSVGECTVRFSLNILPTVYTDLAVSVVDDYKTTVNSITFNNNLAATQGDEVDTSEVFASKVANTHFGTTATITDSELLFSYDNDRSGAVAINMFAYDFSHGSVVSETQKLQTVYVFVTFDEEYAGTSFNITVTQKNDPLTAITLTNPEIENDEVDLVRGSSLQLTWELTPTNPTDTRELQFSIDDSDEGVKVQVSDTGNVTVSSDSGLGSASVLVEAKYKTSVYTYLLVNVTLESMTYKVDEEETLTPTTTVSVGDNVYMVGYCGKLEKNYELTSLHSSSSTHYGVAEEYGESITKSFLLTVVEGTEDNSFAFKTSDNQYLVPQSGKNGLETSDTLNASSSWAFSESRIQNQGDTTKFIYLNWNSGTPRFACYVDKTSTSDKDNFNIPTFMKVSGGIKDKNVTEALFTAVHSNFGYKDTTYTWSESCPSFDFSSWTTAGNAVKGISGFASYELNIAIGDINGNEIEQFIAKYDYVVAKFYKDCKTDQEKANLDFLGRVSSGKVDPDESRISLIGITTNNGVTITIIIISSMISVAAIGGYFFIRRRKHN